MPAPLDAEGLPAGRCPACGAGDFWKPAGLPPEGPGWRCEACDPAPGDLLRHGCAVPPGWRPEPDPDLVNELAEERAAIMEHDGGLSRAEAEAAAGLVRRRSSPE